MDKSQAKNQNLKSKIDQTVTYLQQAENILFITGAGISAASGLPTYRGIGGLYNDQLTEDDIPIELALSGLVMAAQPQVTWRYISQIEAACREAKSNQAHQIIANLEGHFNRVWVLTQNVDGFHKEAGSQNVIDIHGDIHDLICLHCDYAITLKDYRALTMPPTCPLCTHYLRPDVVLFGELLPRDKVTRLMQELQSGFDIIFTIGTTSVFPYIADPVIQAAQQNIPTVEINPSATQVSDVVSIKFEAGAVEILAAIWSKLITADRP